MLFQRGKRNLDFNIVFILQVGCAIAVGPTKKGSECVGWCVASFESSSSSDKLMSLPPAGGRSREAVRRGGDSG